MAPMTFTNTAVHKIMAGDLNIGPISKCQKLACSL